MRVRAAGPALLLAAFATVAGAIPLPELLGATARNARFPGPTRADVGITRAAGGQTTVGQAVMIGNGRTIYVETRDGARALVRPGKIVVRTGVRIARAAPGMRLAGSDVLLEDLVVFTPHLLKVPQISDEQTTGIVLTGAPNPPSTRALLVLTIDPATFAVTRTKYYEGSISDLAAYRRNERFVDVEGHQRPTRVVVDRSGDRTSTQMTLAWRPVPETPRSLFGLSGLRATSPIVW